MPAGDEQGAPPGAIARFEFATAGRIVFGVGASEELPAITAGLGRRVLVVTGGNSGRHRVLIDRIRAGVECLELFEVAGEPSVALAERGAQCAKTMSASVVVAIGGGSAIDAGKAIAALAANPAPALDYLEVVGRGRALPCAALPIVAVPTTAGTGAEVTRNAVLAVPEAQVKVSLRSAHMLPRVALVDPRLALGLPSAITAATGMDALTQLIEPFVSARANPFTDALCRDGIVRVVRALPRAVRVPDDLDARSDLALGALYSGMALANAGLGAVHGFAAPIGGLFSAPHGAVCAALLPHVMRANVVALRARAPAHPALARYDDLSAMLVGRADATADDAVAWCGDLVRALRIPTLASWGVTDDRLDAIVAKAAAASSMKANPIVLTPAELRAIVEAALVPAS